jgi:hypothetical protein
VKQVTAPEPDDHWRSEHAALALVFAELVGRREIWARALEGWNMRESVVVEGWREEGRQEGEMARLRKDVLRALALRFRITVPSDIEASVKALTDRDELSRWFDATQTSDNLDAFRQSVGLPAPAAATPATGDGQTNGTGAS